jgi:CDP-paratose 2-epimerase
LAYLVRCVREGRTYRVYGYKGKQVRDNIHAEDVCSAVLAFSEKPRVGAVYNLGGGRPNSISLVEAIDAFEGLVGKKLSWQYEEQARVGDHICYITNLTSFRRDYPEWRLTRSLPSMLDELAREMHVMSSS